MTIHSEVTAKDYNTTWYLSGPMSGYENFNFETFGNVSQYLRTIGFKIVSPHECDPEPEGLPANVVWERMMTKCFRAMKECGGIILLPGWPESRGAKQELTFGLELGWSVLFYHVETKRLIRMSKKEVRT